MFRFRSRFFAHSVTRGKMAWSGVNICRCGCLSRFAVSVRASSTLQEAQNSYGPNIQGSHLRCLWLRETGAASDFSLHSNIFKSKYLLHLGASPLNIQQMHNVYTHHHFSNTCDISYLFSSCVRVNGFHSSALSLKEVSKVEQSVKALKEQAEQFEKNEDDNQKAVLGKTRVTPEEPTAVVQAKKTLWQRFVAELKHYYHGFRLLFIDIRICSRLLWNLLQGKSLTRRERRQLVRTTADMFRLVPFLVFLLVPFMEFLLPVAIKLFPSMLPSTFAEENAVLEKRKQNLKLKLDLAKFLQDTLRETALQKKKKTGSAAEEFSEFVEKIRSQGISPSTKEILKFAKLFENEITLDNLSRQQLQALCRVLNIQPIGIDAFLRFQLEMKLRQLKADDKMIVKEGIDCLSVAELQAANRARGMRAMGVSDGRLRAQLQQWLTLHLEEHIPTSLLLLSRALYLPEELSAEQQLQATMTELTQTAPTTTEEVKLKAAELAGEVVDNKARLEVIKKEEDIIAAESKDREEAAEMEEIARQMKKEKEAAEILAGQAAVESKEVLRDEAIAIEPAKAEELVDKAPELIGVAGEEIAKAAGKEEKEEPITTKELEEIEMALEEIAGHKDLDIELEELQDLKDEVNEYKEDLHDLKQVMVMTGKNQDDMVESKAAKRLVKRVDRLIEQADSVMQELQAEKDRIEEGTEETEAPLLQQERLKANQQRMAEVMQEITWSKDSTVSVEELLKTMERLQLPIDAKLQSIVEILDEDGDGNIDINLTFQVLDTLGQEKLKLSKAHLTEIINLLKAEMELEEEERMKEKEDKEKKENNRKQGEGQS